MKNILLVMALFCLNFSLLFAQEGGTGLKAASLSELPVIFLSKSAYVHLISDQQIRYRYCSLKDVLLEQPTDNLIRLNLPDSSGVAYREGVLTLMTDKRFCQYPIICDNALADSVFRPGLKIAESQWQLTADNEPQLTASELKAHAYALLKSREGIFKVRENKYGIKARLNNVATLGDYIFIDLSFINKSNLSYNIDQLAFSLEDKRIPRATNSQSVVMTPELSLFDTENFKMHYRNVFVFRKFTFPGNKVLRVALSEQQVSGRAISFDIRYSDILDADMINH